MVPHYVVASCHKERPDWRHRTGSMFNIILLLIYFPLRSKVAVRNSLRVSDFPLPVDSLNAPCITIPGRDEQNDAAIHFSWRSLREVCQSICSTESDGSRCGSLKASLALCVCKISMLCSSTDMESGGFVIETQHEGSALTSLDNSHHVVWWNPCYCCYEQKELPYGEN